MRPSDRELSGTVSAAQWDGERKKLFGSLWQIGTCGLHASLSILPRILGPRVLNMTVIAWEKLVNARAFSDQIITHTSFPSLLRWGIRPSRSPIPSRPSGMWPNQFAFWSLAWHTLIRCLADADLKIRYSPYALDGKQGIQLPYFS